MKKALLIAVMAMLAAPAYAVNTVVTIEHRDTVTQAYLNGALVGQGKRSAMQKLINFLNGLNGGTHKGTVTFAVGSSTQTFRF